MTAQGGDLLAWLKSAIADRERSARDSDKELDRTWSASWNGNTDTFDLVTESGQLVATGFLPGCSSHATLNDPQSILRRCAADRELMELHAGNMHSCPAKDETGYLDEWTHFGYADVCPVVRILAEGYGWAEDQR